MKLTITEQFLWAMYDYREELLNIYDFFKIKTFREIIDDQSFWKNLERKRRERKFSQFINYLKKQGYIRIKENRGVLLTNKGEEKCLSFDYKIKSAEMGNFKKRKDGKWIMIVFDIPEKIRKQRDDFRKFLISLRFKNFQKSIWVSQYDNLEVLKEVINIHSLSKFIKIFIIEEIQLR